MASTPVELLNTLLQVRRARPSDLSAVLEINDEARRWLRARDVDSAFDMTGSNITGGRVDSGDVRLVLVRGYAAATFEICDGDPMWMDDVPGTAVYVSRMAVRRRFSGHGVAHRIFDWAEMLALHRGCRSVRIAVPMEAAGLRRHCERAGFTHRFDPLDCSWPVSLYERRVTALAATA